MSREKDTKALLIFGLAIAAVAGIIYLIKQLF